MPSIKRTDIFGQTREALRSREIDTQQQAIAKWNGALPTTSAGEQSWFNFPIR